MNFIAIIPAKEKSTRVPNKNLKLYKGKSLLVHTINQAKKSKYINKIYISTDSKKILNIAINHKIFNSGLRAKKLSGKYASTHSVIKHEIKKINENFKYVIILQPTSPLRTTSDIDKACRMMIKNKRADTLVSCSKVPENFLPIKMMVKEGAFSNFFDFSSIFLNNIKINKIDKKKLLSPPKKIKQEKNLFARNGAIYIVKKNKINQFIIGGKIIIYQMPISKSLDINTNEDLKKLYLF